MAAWAGSNPSWLYYLERYPLTDELLTAVEEFDGGGTAYRFAWYFWDGEDDVFDVKDLSGIELCRNLRSFSAIGKPEAQYRDRPHRSTARLADAERSESSRRRDL
ncbi:hypothetical protein AJ87_24770 [Rhizobium yanglingense]|nr:hypothetical protein AJ87_24770 [Rhizobium yanglingense]